MFETSSNTANNTSSYSKSAILDTWIQHSWSEGIQIATLPDLSEVIVETRNSVYELTLIDGTSREILIRGGKFFPEKTSARLCGSSMRGSFLKLGGIYAGFSMEILFEGQTVVTSPVQSVRVLSPNS
jgi:hypothetical protein